MATVLKAGAIKIDLEANAKNLLTGFKSALDSVANFGKGAEKTTSQAKRLEDQMKALERRKEFLAEKMQRLNSASSVNIDSFKSLQGQLMTVNDKIATQAMRITELSAKANNSAGIITRLGGAFSRLADVGKSAMQGLFNSIRSVAEIALGNLLANTIGRVAGAFNNYVKSIFAAGGETEKQAAAFEVLTGSAEKSARLMKQINDLAVKTPFKIEQLRDLTKQMLAFGFSQETVIEDIKMLGDITAGTGGDLMLLGRAYGQVRTKGKLFSQELNQLGEQGLAVREILAKDLGITVEELMVGMEKKQINVPFEKLQQVMKTLHKEKFFDLMIKQSDTAKGRFDNLVEGMRLMGQEMLGVDTITGKIKAGSVFDMVSKALGRLLQYIDKNKQAFQEMVQGALGQMITKFQEVLPKILDFGRAVRGFATDSTKMKAAGAILIPIFATLAGVFLAFNAPILLVSGAIAGLFALINSNPLVAEFLAGIFDKIIGLKDVVANFSFAPIGGFLELIKSKLSPEIETFGVITESLAKIWGALKLAFEMALPGLTVLGGALLWLGSNILSAVMYAFETLRQPFNDLIRAVVNLATPILQILVPALSMIFSGLMLVAGSILTVLAPAFQVAWAVTVTFFKGITQMVTGVINIIAGVLNVFVGIIKWVFTRDLGQVAQGFKMIWEGIKQFLAGFARSVFSVFVGIADGIKNTLRSVDLFRIGVDIIEGLVKGIASMAGKVWAEANKIANSVKETIKSALKISSPSLELKKLGVFTVEGFIEGVESLLPKVELIFEEMADLPGSGASQTEINNSKVINYYNYTPADLDSFTDPVFA